MNTRPLATLLFLTITLLVMPAGQARAQAGGDEKVFRGYVGEYPVRMTLHRGADGQVTGFYSYEGRGGELTLKGSVDAKGELTLEEFDGAKKTGAFKGWWSQKEYEPEANISGDWAKAGSKPGGDGSQFFTLVEQTRQPGAAAVTTKKIKGGSKKVGYSVNVEYPQIEGAVQFNRLAEAFVRKEVADFKKEPGPKPGEKDYMPEVAEDTLTVRYTVRLLSDDLISVEFPVDYYEHGAAHGSHAFHVINYDVKSGRELALADLFKPGSNYLGKVSEVAVRQMRRWNKDSADYPGGGGQPYLLDEGIAAGAKPEAENFQNWTLTPRGLVITFDYYQLGAYAAGAPTVVLPYADLKDVLKTDGALAPLLK